MTVTDHGIKLTTRRGHGGGEGTNRGGVGKHHAFSPWRHWRCETWKDRGHRFWTGERGAQELRVPDTGGGCDGGGREQAADAQQKTRLPGAPGTKRLPLARGKSDGLGKGCGEPRTAEK